MILQQNPKRYSKSGNDYLISAGPDIEPLTITVLEEDIVIEPRLAPDIRGVIIYLVGYRRYLASPALFNELAESLISNPHYTWKNHSKVLGARMGRAVPIIPIDTDSVKRIISIQADRVTKSGVKGVEWGISGDDLTGIIKQLVWTLSPSAPKPFDTYTIYDLNLDADYSIESPTTPDGGGLRISEARLAAGLAAASSRVVALNRDFNRIKDLFYFGKISSTAGTRFTTLSVSDGGDDTDVQVVSKESVTVKTLPPLWKRITNLTGLPTVGLQAMGGGGPVI